MHDMHSCLSCCVSGSRWLSLKRSAVMSTAYMFSFGSQKKVVDAAPPHLREKARSARA